MKKSFPRILLLIACVVGGFIISGALYAFTGFSIFGKVHEDVQKPSDAGNAELTSLAYKVLAYIKDGDYEMLAETVHPEYGVVFSPCATVTLLTNRYFRPEQIAAFGDDMNAYVWGVRNGSGEPIEMTPADYFANYVFDKDYSAANIIGVDHVVRSGNALENIMDIFPGVRFVDFYVPGSERDPSDVLTWSSLRLGFEEYEGALWLTVIIHSAWTE